MGTLGMSDIAEPAIKDNIVKLPTLDYDDRNLVVVDDGMGYDSGFGKKENYTSGHRDGGLYPHQRAGDVPQNARDGELAGGQPLYSQVQPMVEVEPTTGGFAPQNYPSNGQPMDLKYSTDGSAAGLMYPSNGAGMVRDKIGFVDIVDQG